jgi:hypothetical protein
MKNNIHFFNYLEYLVKKLFNFDKNIYEELLLDLKFIYYNYSIKFKPIMKIYMILKKFVNMISNDKYFNKYIDSWYAKNIQQNYINTELDLKFIYYNCSIQLKPIMRIYMILKKFVNTISNDKYYNKYINILYAKNILYVRNQQNFIKIDQKLSSNIFEILDIFDHVVSFNPIYMTTDIKIINELILYKVDKKVDLLEYYEEYTKYKGE